ncbi:FAD-dependent monooxygenase [Kitasatospora sp. NPDC058162]|uniref:FAD-dependent monooxygenase n=1 Tax=Kitasatospora sp. NPDC058162 TaxID=3346362 RepID=UPI0036DBC47E
MSASARTSVLISGASIAGPALAHWLGRYGFDVTVVELAPALRGGGQNVDFRGRTHLTVLERMGVLEDLRALDTGGSPITFVDQEGRRLLHLPADFAGGELEIPRGELAQVLHRHSAPRAEYVFGDTVETLEETPSGVRVSFRHGAAREFDLVIGADGLHSTVRRLAFGPEQRYVRHLGYYAATWQLPDAEVGLTGEGGRPGEGGVALNVPGRLMSVGADPRDPGRAGAFCLFASPELRYDRHDIRRQKELVRAAFAGLGWRVPQLLRSLADAPELYFDSISRADVPTWSTGRIALLGDAACGATIGGMGTGTAVVAAYVLAGELALARGDHRAAFARYEGLLRGYAQGCQKGGDRTGPFLAPRTRAGLRLRNGLLNRRWVLDRMLALGKRVSSVELPDYEALLAARVSAAG